MSCLSPEILLKTSTSRLDNCISAFMDLKLISGIDGDLIKDDFDTLKASRRVENLLKAFENKTDRLDQLFNIDIGGIVQLNNATKRFVNIIFTLYHGY